MASKEKLNFGVVGACGRGRAFRSALQEIDAVHVRAVCDTNEGALEETREFLGAEQKYTDYDEMLRKADLDVVIVATPMHLHVPLSLPALALGMHVVCEVPACVSVDEAKELVAACRRSSGTFVMAENMIYTRPSILVTELVRRGLFGTTYYAEGEYLHELKEYNEMTPWRRKWQTGINGITYGTHSLGPVLAWMPGERVTQVCCAGSGHHYKDPRGDEYENEDSCVMLGKTTNGRLVKIRLDMLSERPHALANHVLQGTTGAYESARAEGGRDRVWVRELHGPAHEWHDLAELEDAYLPEIWRTASEDARSSGHGGVDHVQTIDFVKSLIEGTPPRVGIHEAMDMTLPGLVSQQSIEQGGAWLPVPDSRDW